MNKFRTFLIIRRIRFWNSFSAEVTVGWTLFSTKMASVISSSANLIRRPGVCLSCAEQQKKKPLNSAIWASYCLCGDIATALSWGLKGKNPHSALLHLACAGSKLLLSCGVVLSNFCESTCGSFRHNCFSARGHYHQSWASRKAHTIVYYLLQQKVSQY